MPDATKLLATVILTTHSELRDTLTRLGDRVRRRLAQLP